MRKQEVLAVVLMLAACLLVSTAVAEEPAKKKEDKADQEQKAESSEKSETIEEPPVSPIFRAARTAPDKKKGSEASGEVLVITNEDLEKMWANLPPEQRQKGVYQAESHVGQAAPPKPGEQPGQSDALEWLEQRNAATNERRSEAAEAQKKVAELQAKVAELERRALAQRNPLLPRRYAEKDDPEVEDWSSLDNPDRVKAVDQELEKARQELAAAQKELSRLKGSSR